MFSSFHSQTLFLFGTKSNCKCSSIKKTVLFDLNVFTCFSASSAPYPSFISSLIFGNEHVNSVCRDARDYNFPICLGWTDSYFLSLLFNAGLRVKRVTVQRIGTQLQPRTQVINECLWNRAENIVRVFSRVWLSAVNVCIPTTMCACTHMLKCSCCFLS